MARDLISGPLKFLRRISELSDPGMGKQESKKLFILSFPCFSFLTSKTLLKIYPRPRVTFLINPRLQWISFDRSLLANLIVVKK